MRFSAWPWLALLLLIPLLYRWWKKRNASPRVTYSLPVPASAKAWDPGPLLLILRILGLALLIFALARPQNSFRQTQRNVSGVDILMVMDVSASMTIEDLSEKPRIGIAKETMEEFVRGRQNDRIGFVVFSGEALTMVPPTLDYGLLLKSLREVQVGNLKDGTAIGDGLALGVNRLRYSMAKSRVIILLTDGDSNVGKVDPATAGELAAGYGIRVYTIAIGREGRVLMPIRQQGPFGNTITHYQPFDNALNPDLLKKIAQSTNGKFYRVTEASALDSVFSEIDRLESSEVKSNEKIRYEDRFQGPLRWGVLLLFLEQFLVFVGRRWLP